MKLTKQATVRGILLLIAIANMVLVATGQDRIEICEDTLYQTVSGIFLAVAAFRSWWKNNSATKGHRIGDKIAVIINKGDKAFLDEVERLLDAYQMKNEEGGGTDGLDDSNE